MSSISDIATAAAGALGKLAALGTADQIRDYFVQQQITGHRSAGTACPVRVYLGRQLGPLAGEAWLCVCVSKTMVTDVSVGAEIVNPDSVEEFIYRFDHNKYPELEEGRPWVHPYSKS